MADLPDVSAIRPMPTRWIGLGRLSVRVALRRYDVHVAGEENVPAAGPVILASNHIGYIDGPVVFGLSPRPVHTLVKTEMFTGRLGFGLTSVGQIPVERHTNDLLAVKRCLRVLHDQRVVAVFPEGARGRGDVQVCQGGAAYLALVSGAPIVPVACLGTRDDGASTSSWPHEGARIDVVFGEPVLLGAVAWPRKKKEVAAATTVVHDALAGHVTAACAATGQRLPAMPSGAADD